MIQIRQRGALGHLQEGRPPAGGHLTSDENLRICHKTYRTLEKTRLRGASTGKVKLGKPRRWDCCCMSYATHRLAFYLTEKNTARMINGTVVVWWFRQTIGGRFRCQTFALAGQMGLHRQVYGFNQMYKAMRQMLKHLV